MQLVLCVLIGATATTVCDELDSRDNGKSIIEFLRGQITNHQEIYSQRSNSNNNLKLMQTLNTYLDETEKLINELTELNEFQIKRAASLFFIEQTNQMILSNYSHLLNKVGNALVGLTTIKKIMTGKSNPVSPIFANNKLINETLLQSNNLLEAIKETKKSNKEAVKNLTNQLQTIKSQFVEAETTIKDIQKQTVERKSEIKHLYDLDMTLEQTLLLLETMKADSEQYFRFDLNKPTTDDMTQVLETLTENQKKIQEQTSAAAKESLDIILGNGQPISALIKDSEILRLFLQQG